MAHIRHTTQDSSLSRVASTAPSSRTVVINASLVRRALEHRTPVVEELIVDDRSGIRPAQMVENKLSRILKGSSIPVSHLLMRKLLRGR